MLDVCLLGTGGMMPLPYRWLTSMLLRYNGSSLLVDCGEGTQIAVKEKGWSFKPIDVICFTHYHADHISGLPGLLLTMGNAERSEPLTMVGPKGLEKVVGALRMIAPELPFEIKYMELKNPQEDFEINGYHIHAFRVNHNITCYGYSIEIKRAGRFHVEWAKEKDIPQKFWSLLQHGQVIEYEGNYYTPDMVLGKPRKGIKVTYCTDTRPTENLKNAAKNSDLLICEGMYAEPEKLAKAKQYKHMTFYEAAETARDAKVGELWLTHFSPSLVHGESYMPKVQKIFARASLGFDGRSVELDFEEEKP
ncbi:ribonuclease Z [Roseburia sp. 1XD42-69]|uniref:ribonuclease Z n=1 Tax=Roseburia sp. 1XD42-69 TaxID=2320088 RepID=UPI000EA3949D|nr:ribonuclease Z [Roseburia sp. 1XD42-69]RKJ64159.1 ribonuclease Z [Roseburia sp. 1XD42-69]